MKQIFNVQVISGPYSSYPIPNRSAYFMAKDFESAIAKAKVLWKDVWETEDLRLYSVTFQHWVNE